MGVGLRVGWGYEGAFVKTCESGIHLHPIYVNWGCTYYWGYPQFEKGFKSIKKGDVLTPP